MKRLRVLRLGLVMAFASAATLGLAVSSLVSPARPTAVSAAPLANITYSSSFQVQNLDPEGPARIIVTFYDRNTGDPVGSPLPREIPAGGSVTFLASDLPVPNGFVGSAVVSSDKPIAAISNDQTAGDRFMGASHDGVINAATTVYVPLAMKNNSGWNTTLAVQNAGSSDSASTRIEFRDTNNNPIATITAPTIKPGASYILPLKDQASLGWKLVGSATVTSDQPVAVSLNHTNDQLLLSTTGFINGAQKIYAPLIMSNNNGWGTDVQIMNVGSAPATIQAKRNGTDVVDTVTLAPGQAKTWLRPLPGTNTGWKWVGSFSFEGTSPSDRIVGIVNESHVSGTGMSYKAFTGGTNKVFAPLIMSRNSGWWTDMQVMNIGASAATVDLKRNGTDVVDTVVLAPGQSKTWLRPMPGTGTSGKFIGSYLAEGRSPSDQLVGIVNEQLLDAAMQPIPGADNSMAYEAANQ